MKKKLLVGLMTALTAIFMCGCGNNEDVSKYISMGDYKNIMVDVSYYEVNDDELEQYVKQELESYAESMNLYNYTPDKKATKVKKGDIVNIDYEGKKDGVAFDGGTAEGAHLEIGSHSFIDGFEDGLIGVEVGETVDLDLTFPEEYHNEDLAGADVVFTVKVNSIDIKEDPTYDADFFATLGAVDITSYDDYLEYARDSIEKSVEKQNDDVLEQAVFEKLMDICEITSVPDSLIEEKKSEVEEDFNAYAEYYGVDKETLMGYMGESDKSYDEVLAENAEKEAKNELVYMAIAAAEGIDLSDEVLKAVAEEEYEDYGFENAEAMMNSRAGDYFKSYVRREKVLDALKQYVKVNEGDPISALADYIYE